MIRSMDQFYHLTIPIQNEHTVVLVPTSEFNLDPCLHSKSSFIDSSKIHIIYV